MKSLYVLRHARAGDSSGLDDHERPLATEGALDAERLARHLSQKSVAPGLVICSSARRAVETLAPLRPRLPRARVSIERRLYLAGTAQLRGRLALVSDDLTAVLLIGHNPAVGELVQSLAGGGEPDAVAKLQRGMSAGSLAGLRFDCTRWQELVPGAGHLESFTVPGDLGEADEHGAGPSRSAS